MLRSIKVQLTLIEAIVVVVVIDIVPIVVVVVVMALFVGTDYILFSCGQYVFF